MNKTCKQCGGGFEITDEDLEFYKKVSPVINGKRFDIPAPTLCPECRSIQRLGWKNERKLYRCKCDLCGNNMFSIYSPDKPYTVYCPKCWWSDKWDSMKYARDYDFKKPFFEQFYDFIKIVPRLALNQNNNAENCEYTTSTTRNRNCYLISSAGHNEDCYYGMFMPRNKNCIDCTHVMDSELLYECVDCDRGYNLAWCQNTKDCSDSCFLYDCHGARNCAYSYNLRNKQYVFCNEQLTRDKYEEKISQINLGSYKIVKKIRQDFQKFILRAKRLYYEGQNNVDVRASNHIFNSKNCVYCFDCNNLEDCKFCSWYNDSKDCYDVHAFGYGNELCYGCLEVGTTANHLLFCLHCWDSVADLFYCLSCHGSKSLFGCAGLRRKQFCIFNKQYKKEEYEELLSKIVERMQSKGEWGEFFPLNFAHFGYNETVAMDFYPFEKSEISAKDWVWRENKEEILEVEKFIPASELPDKIEDVTDDILNCAIKCEKTGRPFKLLMQELRFYRMHKLPVPHLHPDERHKRRLILRNLRKIWDRECCKCGKEIQTTYNPNGSEKLYCEGCYLKEVY